MDDDRAYCALCTCMDDGTGNLYASCSDRGSSYAIGSKSCDETFDADSESETYSCHNQESNNGIIYRMFLCPRRVISDVILHEI